MSGILPNLCNFDDIINKFNSVLNNTVSQIDEVGFQLLNSLNGIIVNNGEGFLNNTKQAILEALSQAADKTKQDALDVIEQFISNLSNSVDSVIEHAKNVTMDVLDESLEKIRDNAETFVGDIFSNQFLIIVGVFILITLFSITVCLFRHLSKDFDCCSQLFNVLSNMLMILTSLVTFVWFGFTLVWFFERAINDKGPFYIIGAIILVFVILYGICHLCWILKTKISESWKLLCKKSSKHEDSIPPPSVKSQANVKLGFSSHLEL
jgi:magnesium-transporting ATPase (P-type)